MNEKNKRFLLLLAIWLPFWVGWMYYMDLQRKKREAAQPVPAVTAAEPGIAPTAAAPGSTPPELAPAEPGAPSQPAPPTDTTDLRRETPTVSVRTGTYDVEISPVGAVPVRWDIIDPKYALANSNKSKDDKNKEEQAEASRLDGRIELIDPQIQDMGLQLPFEVILKEMNSRFYSEFNRSTFTVNGPTETEDATVLRFESPMGESGMRLIKTYRIPKKDFKPTLTLELINQGQSKISFNNEGRGIGLTLGPGLGAPSEQASRQGANAFSGQSYDVPHVLAIYPEEIQTVDFEDPVLAPDASIQGAGLENRYFLMTLMPGGETGAKTGFSYLVNNRPEKALQNQMISKKQVPFYPQMEAYGLPFTIAPGEKLTFSYEMFAGPKDRRRLAEAGKGLERIMFHQSYSFMRALALLLMWSLNAFHKMFQNWGAAIIALVIALRLLTLPLTHISMKHQAKMAAQQARLKPQLDKLKEKYKDNPTKLSQEQVKLFQEHGVNPLGALKGCVWALIQLPIFIALYKILLQDIDLRGASFLWISDLSEPDKLFPLGFTVPLLSSPYFNLLPILTAVAQFFSAKLSMASSPGMADNPMQKQMMYMMPVFILFIMYSFPSGLALYWLLSNVWQIFQQKFVNKKMMAAAQPAATPAT